MQDVNVVVVFYSRTGTTERLALTAAVGAVQGRANIRLRRLRDRADQATVDKEYIAPRDSDAEWADAIIMGMPAEAETLPAVFQEYFDSLDALRDRGKFEGKIGASFMHWRWTAPLYAAMCGAGLITVPALPGPDLLAAAESQGRRIANAARALRVSWLGGHANAR
jgi:NAD(P)H dehydrogenase (quinone)